MKNTTTAKLRSIHKQKMSPIKATTYQQQHVKFTNEIDDFNFKAVFLGRAFTPQHFNIHVKNAFVTQIHTRLCHSVECKHALASVTDPL